MFTCFSVPQPPTAGDSRVRGTQCPGHACLQCKELRGTPKLGLLAPWLLAGQALIHWHFCAHLGPVVTFWEGCQGPPAHGTAPPAASSSHSHPSDVGTAIPSEGCLGQGPGNQQIPQPQPQRWDQDESDLNWGLRCNPRILWPLGALWPRVPALVECHCWDHPPPQAARKVSTFPGSACEALGPAGLDSAHGLLHREPVKPVSPRAAKQWPFEAWHSRLFVVRHQ